MNRLKKHIQVAMGEKKADLVLKNASIINVFTQTIDIGDIAIVDDSIVGVGKYDGIDEIDCTHLFVSPGFIDSHVHIESTMTTPEIFSHLVIQKGVTTAICDPHEIANISGNKGIKFMLDNSKNAVMDTYFMLPSCVPAVEFENNGARLNANKLSKLLHHPKILGLGEVMDVHSVTTGNNDMLKKIDFIKKLSKKIDGHCPKIRSKELNAYLCSGIRTDHECTDKDEALEKIKHGMMIMLREGSQARDLIHLLSAVTDKNYPRFLFCTDDRHIEDLIEEGSIDHCIRLSIKNGLDPIKAYTIASLNAANCYGLEDKGAIAPGMRADLVILQDLEDVAIKQVIKDGKVYKKNNQFSKVKKTKSIHLNAVNEKYFHINTEGKYANVIKVQPGSLKTNKIKKSIDEMNDTNKIAVVERHRNTGKHFTGFIEGLGLKNITIAQSISHDSHNIIVVGNCEKDMAIAVNHLRKIGGGIVLVSEGQIKDAISLPIGGIMTDEHPNKVYEKMKRLNQCVKNDGIKKGIDPFITLSFMALPVIPDLKITPQGLFDYQSFDFISLWTE